MRAAITQEHTMQAQLAVMPAGLAGAGWLGCVREGEGGGSGRSGRAMWGMQLAQVLNTWMPWRPSSP
jgi:hypothetical protein